MTNWSVIMTSLYILILGTVVQCINEPSIDPKRVVSIKAVSTGCYSQPNNKSNSITINGQEYSQQLDGINIVQIKQDGSILTENFRKELRNFFTRVRLRTYLLDIEPGTVVIIATQNVCRIRYKRWAAVLLFATNISFGEAIISSEARSAIIFGCHGFCPEHVAGEALPGNKFSKWNDDITMETRFGFEGYQNDTIDDKTSEKNANSNNSNNTIVIVLVIVILILIIIISIALLLYMKNKRKWKTPSCKHIFKGDFLKTSCCSCTKSQKGIQNAAAPEIDSGTQEEIYEDLLRRPSALPNIYEPLQKMSVQYEEIRECEEEEEGEKTERKCRADTNLSTMSSSSLGTSQNIFRKISATETPLRLNDTLDFASYVHVSDGNVIYKAPSSVPKFEAPKTAPRNAHRESYITMEMNEYQEANVNRSCTPPLIVPQNRHIDKHVVLGEKNGYPGTTEEQNVYAPLETGGFQEENNYSVLLPN